MLIDTTTGGAMPAVSESREEDAAAPMKLEENTATVKEENDEDPDQSDEAQDKEKSQQIVPEEDLIPDQRLSDFIAKTEEEKD